MMMIKFRSNEDHEELMHKVKKMKKFTEELQNMLEECYNDGETEYRGGSYRKDYDDDDMRMEEHHGRYGYRRGGRM